MRRTATHFIKAAKGTLPMKSEDQGLPSRLRRRMELRGIHSPAEEGELPGCSGETAQI